jgi:predicted extracellular nuclease
VGDYEGGSPALRGFYLQEVRGDGDPATSDAIFVFNGGGRDLVDLGDLVTVSGRIGEFEGQTQLSASDITVCGSGSVEPVDVYLPAPDAEYLERFEGMLVRFPQTLYVTELFQLGRFGEVVLSVADRLAQPTAVALPGPAAAAVQRANDLAVITLDDALNDQNPAVIHFGSGGAPLSAVNTVRGGDTVTGVIGVLTYTWSGNAASGNTWRLRPIGALGGAVPSFVSANPRPPVPQVGGTLRVATLNVLNYFTTLRSRGAASPLELQRQRAKLVATLTALDADIVGLVELENHPDALADLVRALNDQAGRGTYAAVRTGVLGSDEIAVGIVYRRTSVAPAGDFAVLDDDFDPSFREAFNRPVLAQTFVDADGKALTVSVVHLKSKGSDCLDVGDRDAGDGQGNCNQTRTLAATVLARWLATDPTNADDPDQLVLGDFNAYLREDPIVALEEAGFVSLLHAAQGERAYTFAFDGMWGALDHAFASASLTSQVTGTAAWHVNADEPSVLDYNVEFKSRAQVDDLYSPNPYRASDHDPLLIGIELR